MTRTSTLQYWSEIVIAAYRSGDQIRHWCRERGINDKNFHRWANKLGYTENGRKTEKYFSLMEEEAAEEPADVVTAPVFVEVPSQVLDGFREPTHTFPCDNPLITIQSGIYQIGVRDGFSEKTLSKVLEVIRYA